jgi:hypothetical protein
MKPSAVWIIAGVLILFFLANHWMSCEISQTTTAPPKQIVEAPLNIVPENKEQPLTIPGVPIDEKIVEPPVNTAKAPKAVEQENQGPSEPIYEAQNSDVILAQ